jgi:GNAT superfamily N-acetyltransferase
MIHRYGTCAILAWEDHAVVGQLWFYPMSVAHLLEEPSGLSSPLGAMAARDPDKDGGTLWVQCVMSCRPYVGPEPDVVTGHNWPAMAEARARRGVGLKLVHGLIAWARKHGWKRIARIAHADLDCFYGQLGAGGKAFWEKAGFTVVNSFYYRPNWGDEYVALALSQGQEQGMTERDVWTWYQMVCEM